MSFSAASSPTTGLPGLTTPNLQGGEFSKNKKASNVGLSVDTTASSNLNENKHEAEGTNSSKANNSVFEIASDIEEKLRELNRNIESHDTEVNKRLDTLLTRIRTLEKKMKNNGGGQK